MNDWGKFQREKVLEEKRLAVKIPAEEVLAENVPAWGSPSLIIPVRRFFKPE